MIFYLTLPFAKRHSSYLCSFCWLMLTHDFQTCLGGKRNHKIDIKAPSAADSFDFLILRTLFWWNEFTILAGCPWTVCVYRSWINQLDFWFMFIANKVSVSHSDERNYSSYSSIELFHLWLNFESQKCVKFKDSFSLFDGMIFLGKYFLPQMMMATSKMNNDFNVYERCMLFRLNNFLIADAFYAYIHVAEWNVCNKWSCQR